MQSNKKYQIDMCHGSLFSQIFRFSLPIICTNLMVILFQAADLIVLGQFAAPEVKTAAVAAVGSTAALHVMLLVFFFGFGAGVNAITARYVGAKDHKKVSRTVHTSFTLGIYAGVFIGILGILFSRTALRWMGTPDDVLGKATLYLQICSIGLPFTVIYTIGAAILRSIGDTQRPLLYITIAGVFNVLLNIFFVTVCGMDAAGVALATKLSNVLSACLIIRTLLHADGALRLQYKKLRIHWATLKEVLWIGIPAGFQGALYSISNIFIQSSVNSLGSSVMAGNSASQSLEGIASMASGAYYQTAMSFTGQNLGGKKYKRIIQSIMICLLYTIAFSMIMGGVMLAFGKPLLGLYNPDPFVIRSGMERFTVMMCSYFLCSTMDTISGALRGLGHSVKPTVTTIMGTCVLRIFWVLCIFPQYRTMQCLMISYPISWILTAGINGLILYYVCRRMLRGVVADKHYYLCGKA